MWEIDRLNRDELQKVFGAERRWLRAPGFPAGEADATGVTRWPADQVWEWLATQNPQAAATVPLRYWPRGEAILSRTQAIEGGVIQDWTVHGIILRLLWPTAPAYESGWAGGEAAKVTPPVPRVVKVRHDFGLRGPSLWVLDQRGEHLDADGPVWPELALVLGGRAPYWPYGLRDAAAMSRWRPGDEPVEIASSLVTPDPTPLLQLAATLPADTTAHAVLTHLAADARYRAGRDVAQTIKIITTELDMAHWTELAATSPAVTEPADLDEVVLRDGWLNIAARTDTLARNAMRAVLASGHNDGFPYTAAERIDPSQGLGAEWAARLQPCTVSAGFEILFGHLTHSDDTVTDYLTDPATDAPAVRLSSGQIVAAVPHRLPTTSALAALTLDKPIWIRLADGTIHLAPRRDAPGINWGYPGSGTNSLARLTASLLDDVTAPATTRYDSDSPGLLELLTTDWPHGTTFARDQLETARHRR
ncbi:MULTISPECIES: hypothetical protein [Nocardia]|uniref:Uncharacterized protein n=1 Tax=Nocardia thailandica TaxID=257275 RepID=A0ABW6PX66_9NOCA|nr:MULTISPECIES: hypothetical protein [Nocardia]